MLDEADNLVDGNLKKETQWIIKKFLSKNQKVEQKIDSDTPSSMTRTQFICAVASIPNKGRRSTDRTLRKFFPRAQWVTTPRLHRILEDQVDYEWIPESSIKRRLMVCREVLRKHYNKKVLVFANSHEMAERLYDHLEKHDLNCRLICRSIEREDRIEALQAFNHPPTRKTLNVLICTDILARGYDFKQVDMVINFEFPKDITAFIHRTGRTGRLPLPANHKPGQMLGKVINFYGDPARPHEVDLVRWIQESKDGRLDRMFSRNRGFRRAMRKYGSDGSPYVESNFDDRPVADPRLETRLKDVYTAHCQALEEERLTAIAAQTDIEVDAEPHIQPDIHPLRGDLAIEHVQASAG